MENLIQQIVIISTGIFQTVIAGIPNLLKFSMFYENMLTIFWLFQSFINGFFRRSYSFSYQI